MLPLLYARLSLGLAKHLLGVRPGAAEGPCRDASGPAALSQAQPLGTVTLQHVKGDGAAWGRGGGCPLGAEDRQEH